MADLDPTHVAAFAFCVALDLQESAFSVALPFAKLALGLISLILASQLWMLTGISAGSQESVQLDACQIGKTVCVCFACLNHPGGRVFSI